MDNSPDRLWFIVARLLHDLSLGNWTLAARWTKALWSHLTRLEGGAK